MSEHDRPPGKTTVAPGVLTAVARLAALAVPGVKDVRRSMGSSGLFRRRVPEGVRMDVQDGLVSGDIYVVLKGGYNLREVGREVQSQVSRAIRETVGTGVARIDIHIEDIDYEVGEA